MTARTIGRDRIRAVRANDLNKLEIVLLGEDPVEMAISFSRAETQRAVDALNDALSACRLQPACQRDDHAG